jgi:methyl-accepting chemotaxis protein
MIISFMTVIVLMVVQMTVAVISLSNVTNSYEYAVKHPIGGEIRLLNFRAAVNELRNTTTRLLAISQANDPATVATYSKEGLTAYNSGLAYLDEFDNGCKADPRLPQEQMDSILSTTANMRDLLTQYKTEVFDMVSDRANEGDFEGAMGYLLLGTEMSKSLMELCTQEIEGAENVTTLTVNDANTSSSRTFWILLGVAVVAAIISIIISILISRIISKPIVAISDYMRKAGTTGDLVPSKEEDERLTGFIHDGDEIGTMMKYTGIFMKHIIGIATEIERIAGGDLTADVSLLSDRDMMGQSLNDMVTNLNSMFAEINTSTAQVSSGAKQVADGAQSLAQGSTEQSASMDDLSSSISEIATRTRANVAIADQTVELSETIKNNAEKGSCQMNEMITAVGEINNASRNIGKIIKTIDDIAFQTNILALNAAVEAARAGHHGKGFAVVAEEVRNLASKSAEAAKDTGNMIQNTIEKAELGSRIAGETAESFSEIVSGISESANLISEIAKASEEQSREISQINASIDELSNVVQQNSATSEESASASQEMSGLSDALQQLIAQFKLKNSTPIHRDLPPTVNPSRKRFAISKETACSTDFGKY